MYLVWGWVQGGRASSDVASPSSSSSSWSRARMVGLLVLMQQEAVIHPLSLSFGKWMSAHWQDWEARKVNASSYYVSIFVIPIKYINSRLTVTVTNRCSISYQGWACISNNKLRFSPQFESPRRGFRVVGILFACCWHNAPQNKHNASHYERGDVVMRCRQLVHVDSMATRFERSEWMATTSSPTPQPANQSTSILTKENAICVPTTARWT